MYKNKYLKYKKKYFDLKKNISNNQKGGRTLLPILFQYDIDMFEGWYGMKSSPGPNGENKNSFEILLDLFEPVREQIEPFNILVGAKCANPVDYFRFRDSPNYSLYIDLFNQSDMITPDKQYFMYSIDYKNVDENLERMPSNMIESIHFDTGVSYFAPINYLRIADHLLIPGGKIIWDLLQHQATIFMYDNTTNKLRNPMSHKYFSQEQVDEINRDNNIFIDFTEKKIVPAEGFFTNNTIAPQMPIKIVYIDNTQDKPVFKEFTNEPYNGFIDFCNGMYPNFIFEMKSFSFLDYTYPVPLRITNPELEIATFMEFVDFIVNKVMNFEERKNYVETKKISIEKLIQLTDRISRSEDIKRVIIEKRFIPNELLNICEDRANPLGFNIEIILDTFISNEFQKNFNYIEATKR